MSAIAHNLRLLHDNVVIDDRSCAEPAVSVAGMLARHAKARTLPRFGISLLS
jgi:hypothetical protein